MSDYNGWTNRNTWLINLHFGDLLNGYTEDGIEITADLIKEIFKHNKHFEIGWMKINPKGLITFAFKFGDLETSYYLVRNQNQ